MIHDIRPIRADEWLPDRCLSMDEPFDPRGAAPRHGCPSLLLHGSRIRNRIEFEKFYHSVLNRFSGCGFVAWENGGVIGYTNFFPQQTARKLRFYGWGETKGDQPGALVHHCISIVRNTNYRRKGIGTQLLQHSLHWAKRAGWIRYEVHNVLPDGDNVFAHEQKAAVSFWRKFGFAVIREQDADAETIRRYGAKKRYSLALNLGDLDDAATAFGPGGSRGKM